ncbi:hypothetical protein CAEBREN_04766 [Caenorhabditis brenneri]|uniref:Uncharacterized protein n=1 Tax=Caenorhabditis brenneri TaxID=135651 RepID=G0NGI8_CAEBE|nr:hypothetical protein CAEBREN_04766 [Caenorhabditis brenneri]
MSGRTFPKKNSGKMNRERRYGRGGRDEEGHNGYYDDNQKYWLEGQNRGREDRRDRVEQSERNGGGAGRGAEELSRSQRQRGHRYKVYSHRSHRNEGNGGDRDHGDRKREDRNRGHGGNGSRYNGHLDRSRGDRGRHEINQRAMEGPKVQRLKAKVEEMEKERAFYMYGAVSGNRVAYNKPRRQQPPPSSRRQPPPAPASAAPVPRRGKTIITETRDYSDEDDDEATVEEFERKQRALAERQAKIREQVIRQMKGASTPPGSPPPFVKDDE